MIRATTTMLLHSSEEMAEFLLALYDSDACVGAVDRNSFEFSLQAARFDYAGERQFYAFSASR
ncbi:MAG: hypothetical protein ACLVCW_05990 [Campylobacter sp.]